MCRQSVSTHAFVNTRLFANIKNVLKSHRVFLRLESLKQAAVFFSPKKNLADAQFKLSLSRFQEFSLSVINMPGINLGLARSGRSMPDAPKHSESAVLISIAPLIDGVYRGDEARLPDVHVGLLSAVCRLPHSKLSCQSAHCWAESPLGEALYLQQEEACRHFKHPLWETGHRA